MGDYAGIAGDESKGGAVESCSAFGGASDRGVDELYNCIVLFYYVSGVGRAGSRDVCVGVGLSTKWTGRGLLMAMSLRQFAIVELSP